MTGVLIAGAGIGGLTTALALLQRGIDVEIYEQSSTLGEIGAGFQIGANGARVLFSLGLEEQIRRRWSFIEGKIVRLWNTGQSWKLFDLGEVSAQRWGFPYFVMHRADLHAILVDAVRAIKPGAIHLGRPVAGCTVDTDGATLEFDDGSRAHGDVLVGADGVHSVVRRTLFGADEAAFTGCIAWRGLVPADRLPAHLMAPVGTNWVGSGRHIVHYPVRGGALLNFVAVVDHAEWTEESWTLRGSQAECAADFAGWHEDVQAIIAAIDAPYKWAFVGREPMTRWSVGRATLLGDACHPTLPFLAQGAGMAMEDGVILARCLDGHADVPRALRRYEAARLERTAQVARGSAENGRRFHSAALSTVAGAEAYAAAEFDEGAIERRYDWLFRYDALTTPIEATSVAAMT